MQLVDLVLGDGIIRDLLDDVADAGQRGGFAGASARAQAAAPVLAAVSMHRFHYNIAVQVIPSAVSLRICCLVFTFG